MNPSKPDLSALAGRLAGMVRISDSRGSDIASQKSTIEGLARTAGLPIIRWYEDLDRKRWQYNSSKVIATLIADARSGLFDWLVIDKQQRIGTFNERELFHFFTELDRHGVRVWSVAEGDLSEGDILSSLNSVIASQSELKDQTNKAQNVARGMRENALKFRYNGSTLPCGYDRVCLATDGTERYRVVEDRREINPNYIPGSKDPGHQRNINHFEVIYPNGHVERRINPPGKGKQERYDFAISVRSKRVEAARLVFKMFADGFNRTEIAVHMNAMNMDGGFKTYWQATNITYMLANPIYGGKHSWRRTTSAIYSTILPDGSYEVVDSATQRKRRSGRVATEVEEVGQIRAEGSREDLRIIDESTLVRVRSRLADELMRARGSRRPRSDSLWIQPFLSCGHCGGSMRGHRPVGREASAYFLCGNHSKSANLKVGGPACVANRIGMAEIDAKLAKFLDQYGFSVEGDLESAYHRNMEHFEIPRSERGVLLTRLRDEMEAYVLDRLPSDQHDRLDAPGGISLAEAYKIYYSREEGVIERVVSKIEDEIGELAVASARFKEDSIARKKLDSRIAELEADATRERAALVPLDERIDAVHRQLTEINESIRSVAANTAAKRGKQAGEELRKILEKIVVFSSRNPRVGGPNPARLVERIAFHPLVGPVIEFHGDRPKSSLDESTLDRARALIADGATLGATARTLNSEGLVSPRGKRWRSNILARQLGPDFCETHGRARPKQSRVPRNTRDGRGA